MTKIKLIEALREIPKDSRKATLEVYVLCIEAAEAIEKQLTNTTKDYIEREAIKYEQWSVGPLNEPLRVVRESTINSIPSADVAPIQHGKWIPKRKIQRIQGGKNYTCSECNLATAIQWHYCPNCGVMMDE